MFNFSLIIFHSFNGLHLVSSDILCVSCTFFFVRMKFCFFFPFFTIWPNCEMRNYEYVIVLSLIADWGWDREDVCSRFIFIKIRCNISNADRCSPYSIFFLFEKRETNNNTKIEEKWTIDWSTFYLIIENILLHFVISSPSNWEFLLTTITSKNKSTHKHSPDTSVRIVSVISKNFPFMRFFQVNFKTQNSFREHFSEKKKKTFDAVHSQFTIQFVYGNWFFFYFLPLSIGSLEYTLNLYRHHHWHRHRYRS